MPKTFVLQVIQGKDLSEQLLMMLNFHKMRYLPAKFIIYANSDKEPAKSAIDELKTQMGAGYSFSIADEEGLLNDSGVAEDTEPISERTALVQLYDVTGNEKKDVYEKRIKAYQPYVIYNLAVSSEQADDFLEYIEEAEHLDFSTQKRWERFEAKYNSQHGKSRINPSLDASEPMNQIPTGERKTFVLQVEGALDKFNRMNDFIRLTHPVKHQKMIVFCNEFEDFGLSTQALKTSKIWQQKEELKEIFIESDEEAKEKFNKYFAKENTTKCLYWAKSDTAETLVGFSLPGHVESVEMVQMKIVDPLIYKNRVDTLKPKFVYNMAQTENEADYWIDMCNLLGYRVEFRDLSTEEKWNEFVKQQYTAPPMFFSPEKEKELRIQHEKRMKE